MIPKKYLELSTRMVLGPPSWVPVTAAEKVSGLDYIKSKNPMSRIIEFSANFNFLKRDNPGKNVRLSSLPLNMTDPYSYADVKSEAAHAGARSIIAECTKEWKALGLPTTIHPHANVEIPDDEKAIKMAMNNPKLAAEMTKRYGDICLITANVDSLIRFTLQRYVREGWYLRSYSTKTSPVLDDHKLVIQAILRGFKKYQTTQDYRTKLQAMKEKSADPFRTNTGWPHYTSSTNESIDTEKLRTASEFRSCFKRFNVSFKDGDNLERLERLHKGAGRSEVAEYVMASAVSRRSKQVTKPLDFFEFDDNTLRLAAKCYAVPDMRKVYMYSYLANIEQRDTVLPLKTCRANVIGAYSDEDNKSKWSAFAAAPANADLITLEIDASGFDENASLAHHDYFSEHIATLVPELPPAYVSMMLKSTRRHPILTPHPSNYGDYGDGLAVIGQSGLQSGAKATGEIGTFYTMWIIAIGYYRAKFITISDIEAWAAGSMLPDRLCPLILGDDNLHYLKDFNQMALLYDIMIQVYKEFSIEATVLMGDRFLMRHVHRGSDLPVLGRIYSQRLANEKVAETSAQYSLGVIASIDGADGVSWLRQYSYPVTKGWRSEFHKKLYFHVMGILFDQLKSASIPPFVVQLKDKIMKGTMDSKTAMQNMNYWAELHVKIIAGSKNKDGASYLSAYNKWIDELVADKESPSAAYLIDMISRTDPKFALALKERTRIYSALQDKVHNMLYT